VVYSANGHHVQQQNGPYKTCEPLQLEDGRLFQERGLDVQGVPLQAGAYGNETGRWFERRFY